uniref:Sema domain, immunoglobulin domain (Ig), short basic domain, secreted, (semaphorin) 3Ab n=1 Tax=Oryzias sinensis TaxID=183150 RepID=A0A8C7Y488_9TELE
MGFLWGNIVLLCAVALLRVEGSEAQQTKNNVPRLKLSYKEMLESKNLETFEGLSNSSAYHTLFLDEEKGRLVVGAKDHILSFNLLNISKGYAQIPWSASPTRRDECKWAGKDVSRECANFIKVLQPFNQTHVYVCGTGAFHPVCSYLEVGKKPEDGVFKLEPHVENGRGKSPYDPKLLTASMLIDGELYAGTAADFMGRDFAIFRTLGKHHPIRTEQHDSRWLNDPRFLGIYLIPENDNPEDDKIYLFFRENAMEGEHAGKAVYARIGQLCKVNKYTDNSFDFYWICHLPGSRGGLRQSFMYKFRDIRYQHLHFYFTFFIKIWSTKKAQRTRRQDIRNGDPLTQCSDLQHQDELNGLAHLQDKTVYGVENSSTFLECIPKSQRAATYWQYQHSTNDRKQEIKSAERFIHTSQGLLIRTLDKKDSGIYLCQAVEHGFMQTVLKVNLEVIDSEHLGELLHRDEDATSHVHKLWYRDFLSLVNHPNLNSVDDFCEQVWKRERKHQRQKSHLVQQMHHQQKAVVNPHSHMHAQGLASKWKLLQEKQKGRNRRTHELERAPRSV